MSENKSKDRRTSMYYGCLDLIRVFAILMVLYNHRTTYTVAAEYAVWGKRCMIIQALATLCRCGVPLFFMASGALLLKKKEDFSYILRHRLVRIIIVMIICTLIRGWGDWSFSNLINVFFTKLNWYLYAYFDYLFMLPVLRYAVGYLENNGRIFVLLVSIYYSAGGALIFAGRYTGFIDFAPLYNSQFASVCWGIIFPLTGWWLINETLSRTDYVLLSFGAMLSLLASILLVVINIQKQGGGNVDQLRLHFIYLPSAWIFAGLKCFHEEFMVETAVSKIIKVLAGTTFGIFIIETHSEMINYINWKITGTAFARNISAYWFGWVSLCIQFVVCTAITLALKKIPGIKNIL